MHLCARSSYQGQGQFITSYRYCGMELLVPALDKCFWIANPYMGQVTKLWLSCYLVLLSIAKPGNKTATVLWPDPYVKQTVFIITMVVSPTTKCWLDTDYSAKWVTLWTGCKEFTIRHQAITSTHIDQDWPQHMASRLQRAKLYTGCNVLLIDISWIVIGNQYFLPNYLWQFITASGFIVWAATKEWQICTIKTETIGWSKN